MRKKSGQLVLGLILFLIITLNFRPGFFILGNDNYSPEQNPKLSLERYILSPAWRGYRGLGVPSDAEQIDLIRSLLFAFLSRAGIPLWLISQFSIWLAFFLGPWSMAHLGQWIFSKLFKSKKREEVFILSGLFYFANMLTIWLFSSPLKPFIFFWGFLPFFLWRSLKFALEVNLINFFLFLISLFCFTLSGVIPTIFLVGLGVIMVFYFIFALLKISRRRLVFLFFFLIVCQFFWLIPFIFYVKSNSQALQDSYINRMITPNTIQIEAKYNVFSNIVRYYTSWLDTKNDDGSLIFKYGLIYQNNIFLKIFSFIPLVLLVLGLAYLIKRKKWPGLLIFLPLLLGVWLIMGVNSPFRDLYNFFWEKIPFFKQVFRWGSSKFWPFLNFSLPFLASFGFVFLTERFSKKAGKITFGLLVFTQLIFCFPFFKRELIGRRDFVKIPDPYFELKDFLKENDFGGRVYPAPEANMLYFRNHDWGFYGSVFLNYLIPNPVMEKALITGSYENEIAYFNLSNAYYSENPEIFQKALSFYKIAWVVSDKSVTDKGNGYRYDWKIHEKVIDSNPFLEKIWEQDFLSLYKVNLKESYSQSAVYENHDQKLIQKVGLLWEDNSSLISAPGLIGSIYPVFLTQNEIEINNEEVKIVHEYQGKEGNFVLNLPTDFNNLPTKGTFLKEEKKVVFEPSLPELFLNDEPILRTDSFPRYTLSLADFNSREIKFISLGDVVWDLLSEEEKVFDFKFGDVEKDDGVRIWDKLTRKTETSLEISEDALLLVSFYAKSEIPKWVNLCFESERIKGCFNKNISFWIDNKAPELFNVVFDFIVKAPDKLTIWLPQDSDFNLKESSIYYSGKSVFLKKELPEPKIDEKTIHLKKEDLISTAIPFLNGQVSYHFYSSQDSKQIPEIFSEGEVSLKEETIIVESKEGPAGFYSKFSPLEKSNHLMMVAFKGDNVRGIPLDINFRDLKEEYKIWFERMRHEKKSSFLSLFITPKEIHNYILEFYLYSQGKESSINEIESFVFQPLPLTWTEIKLVPEKEETINVFGINQSFHQYWYSREGKKAKINGWEEGRIIEEKKTKVSFWPNRFAWGGYLVDFILIVAVVGWMILKTKKSSLPSKS